MPDEPAKTPEEEWTDLTSEPDFRASIDRLVEFLLYALAQDALIEREATKATLQ